MCKESVTVQPKQIEVYGKTDILVVGGGIAGIAAAVAAARNGKKVTLVEKACVLGGLATLGHVCIYLPLDDGVGNKVFGGLAEELLHVSIRRSYNTLSEEWPMGTMRVEKPTARYRTHFNIPAAIFSFDEILEEEGVEVLFDAVFSEPIMEGDVCKGVVLETKQGRVAYMADMIVDASGDADVMYRAGADCVEQKSIVSHWAYELDLETMKKGIETGSVLQTTRLRWLGLRPDVDNSTNELTQFYGTTIEGVNGYLKLSRKLGRTYLDQRDGPDYAMMSLPYMPQFRMTRRIVGVDTLDTTQPDVHLDNSVGCLCFSLAAPAPVFEFPYGAILSPKVKNIAAAGRIISADQKGWEIMRLIPGCAFTGEVAGTAAAMALDQGVALQDVDIAALQAKLEANGVIVHEPDYMKGNGDTSTRTKNPPKYTADPLICSDALSYH